MSETSDKAKKYFYEKTGDEARAIFEAAISLSMLYHKLIGMPVKGYEECEALERALSLSVKSQPFKKEAYVRIYRDKIRKKVEIKGKSPYAYVELEGDMFELHVRAEYGSAYAVVGMKFVDELKYPLMYIEKIGSK